MSFRVRDTSSQYQPKYEEQEPIDKKGKKGKKQAVIDVPKKVTKKSGGFQLRYDPTNQCDYH
jgi:hypothetical protein